MSFFLSCSIYTGDLNSRYLDSGPWCVCYTDHLLNKQALFLGPIFRLCKALRGGRGFAILLRNVMEGRECWKSCYVTKGVLFHSAIFFIIWVTAALLSHLHGRIDFTSLTKWDRLDHCNASEIWHFFDLIMKTEFFNFGSLYCCVKKSSFVNSSAESNTD